MFPKIERPCPYIDRLASVMDGDFCRMCKRTVTDLDALDARERRDFLSACRTEDACVTYKIKPALAAAAMVAAMAGAAPAMAQDKSADDDQVVIVTAGRIARPQIVEVTTPVPLLTAATVRPHPAKPRRAPRRTPTRSTN